MDTLEVHKHWQREDRRHYALATSFTSSEYGDNAVVETFENLFHHYMQHPEAKSLGPDGEMCKSETRGLLQRAHIVADRHRRIGKEFDRKWEEGDAFESLTYEPLEYRGPDSPEALDGFAVASERLIRKIKKVGIRKLVGLKFGRRILERICRRQPVKCSTLREYQELILEFEL